jgi:dienelactone hydrolase
MNVSTDPDSLGARAHASAAIPLYLDAAEHTCAAWWHAPDVWAAPALPLAVVLASSWGGDDVSAYDGQRALAAALAEAGIGVLRFEWPDTGDSSASTGTVTGADALAALDAAADAARACSGRARLAFVGLRIGALLAAHAAVARRDVEALVALLPVGSGRSFLREASMVGAAKQGGAAASATEAPEVVMLGGFGLPRERALELSALKWPTGAATTLTDALFVAPPEAQVLPSTDALARMGVQTSVWTHPELADLLAREQRARLAPEAIAHIVAWLRERALEQALSPAQPPRRARPTSGWLHTLVGGVPVRERLCEIAMPRANGELASTLIGVTSERDIPQAGLKAPNGERGARRGIVLLSSGHERRIGPHRLWVPFARERGARGDVVLRLDLAGVGDSERRSKRACDAEPDPYDTRCVDDIARAVAWMRREHGVGAITVMGLCSGALHAWRAALFGIDVQHVVAINPEAFHGRPPATEDGAPAEAVAPLEAAGDDAKARARHALRLRAREFARALHWPLRDDLAAELAQVCRRGIGVDFVFSGYEPGLALLREETGRRGLQLERTGAIRVCEIAQADHTFSWTPGRLALYARLDALLDPAAAAAADAASRLSHPPAAAHS